MSPTIWGIHIPNKPDLEPVPMDDTPDKDKTGYIVISRPEMGDLSQLSPDREEFKKKFLSVYPHAKTGAIPVQAGVLYRFCCEISIGDLIVYPSKSDRLVNIGQVTDQYHYLEFDRGYLHLEGRNKSFPHLRCVKWLKQVPRSEFSQSALHEIGSAITLFAVTSHADEFMAALEGKATGANDIDDENVEEVSTQVEESTEDFIIKRLKSKLTPYEFEKFVAHLLTRMGFFARITSQSADGGIDIIAHKDELGFEPPIIKVQCKQTLDTIGRPKVQELHGAIEQGEHGLFVTLGTYTSDARTFERGKPNLRLIDGPGLVDLIYKHYERFEPRYQMLLPLKRTYIPGPSISSAD